MDLGDNFQTITHNDATSQIKDNYMLFGESVLSTKFPDHVDGCKSLIRRIIWFTNEYKDIMPLDTILGSIGRYHTTSGSSVYDALIRLGQDFMVGNPIIYIKGNCGKYYEPGAAASRYLSAKVSDFAKDIYFEGVHQKTIPMVPTKDFSALEPKYLIPRLPMALILGNITVGFGFKSYIPMLDFNDVCNLTLAIAKYYKERNIGIPDYKPLAKYIIPAFPIKNLIINRKELLNDYAHGNFNTKIKIEGWVELNGNTITLKTVPYGINFEDVTSKLREKLKDRKCFLYEYIDSANQYSGSEPEFTITLRRGKNPFEVLDVLRPILKFNNNWKPIYSYLKNDRVVTLNPIELVCYWYKERAISLASGLKYKQADLIHKRMALESTLVICDNKDKVIKIIENSDDKQSAIQALFDNFEKLTWKQAEIIYMQPVGVLAKSTRGEIEAALEQNAVDLENVLASYGKVHDTIINDALYLQKKYAQPKATVYADDFIGYVQFGNLGIINFFDLDHMKEILNSKGWPSAIEKTVHFYDKSYPKLYAAKHGKLVPIVDLTKEITCEQLVMYPETRAELTLAIGPDNSTCVVERAVEGVYEGYKLFPISKTFYAIHRNGTITQENYQDFAIRKSVSKGARTDVVYALPDKTSDMVVFQMSTSSPNILRINRILYDDKLNKIITSPSGKLCILGIYSYKSKQIILNIPASCRKSSAIEQLIVENVSSLFPKDKDNLMINLGKLSTDKNFKLKRDNVARMLYTLQTK